MEESTNLNIDRCIIMDKINFISAVRDFSMYKKVIQDNQYVKNDNIKLSPIDNTKNNLGLSKRYNDFLENYDYSKPSWFVFCHEDWEILESVEQKLNNLDRSSLYGSFGSRLIDQDGVLIREYVGDIYERSKNDDLFRKLGKYYKNFTKVDTLDCQTLFVHSELIHKYKLRFDEKFQWDLYVEDFCLNAYTKYSVESKVFNLEVCHWSPVLGINTRPHALDHRLYINKKYAGHTFAGITMDIGDNTDKIISEQPDIRMIDGKDRSKIYQTLITSANDARYIAMKYIEPNKKILDVGCACGDFAVALKAKKPAELWGMEYNQGSIDIAKQTKAFEDIYNVDLDNFDAKHFKQLFGFFDYIIFGDVLEHILYPQKTLDKFKLFLKSNGLFLLSIPNIAHASIKAGIISDEFTYTPCGLLDETHLRFFTKKTIPSFLSSINLEIVRNEFTFQDKLGCQPTNPYTSLPLQIKRYIFEDYHSYVLQYVMKVKKSNLSYPKSLIKNEKMLNINELNAPKGLIELRNNDLAEIGNINDYTEHLELILDKKDHEIQLMKSSKFWKLRTLYAGLRDTAKHPGSISKKLWKQNLSTNQQNKNLEKQDLRISDYLTNIFDNNLNRKKMFIDISKEPFHKNSDIKALAFYLPQFHPIDLNDKFYGKGFTEWTNVTSAIPQFTGHYQPQLPYDVGFYDLRNEETIKRQVELARLYGIYGFCFYYYWFSGKKLLETPINNFLKNKSIDFPFCLCWANENWSKLWDAGDNELLMKQMLQTEDDEKFMHDILPFFKDKRYIKIDSKPVLIVYRPHLFDKNRAKALFINFRKIAKNNGLPDLYIIAANSHGFSDNPNDWGLDAIVEFPPHGVTNKASIINPEGYKNSKFKGHLFDMKSYIEKRKYIYKTDYKLFKTIFPGWDNTARKAYSGANIFEMNPALYKKWLRGIISYTKKNNSKNEQYIFINAWNEWAEGAHLEPDTRYGYAYLQATKDVLEKS